MNHTGIRIWGLALLVLLLATGAAHAVVDIYVVGGGDGFSNDEDLAEFHAAHPDIRINILNAGTEQVLAMLATGNAPDLIRVESRYVPFWTSKGLLEDLNPYIDRHARFITRDTLVPVNDLYQIDGRQYALNKDWSADLTLYYNKDIFDQAGLPYLSEEEPISYEEIMTFSQRFSSTDPVQGQRWGFSTHYAPLALQGMLRAAGLPLYTDDQTQALLQNPRTLEAAQWWVEMAHREFFIPTDVNAAWHGGNLGILQSGFWFGPVAAIGGYQNVHGNEAVDQGTTDPIGFAPAPTWEGNRVNLAVATGFAMFADSPNKEAAWKALEWFMAGPPAIRRTQIGWGIPPLTTLFEHIPSDTELDRQRFRVTIGELPYFVTHFENRYDAAAFDAAWNHWFPQAAAQTISPLEFMIRVEQDVNAELARASQP